MDLRRIVLMRHGETVGDSSVRFHGSGDIALSNAGRRQVRDAAQAVRREVFNLVVASPLQRSWASAWLVGAGAPVRLENDFREIDFGRWEGMSVEEIQASDPARYLQWQSKAAGFEFPSGEPRAEFNERVKRGVERLQRSGASNVLAVLHKGVIRRIADVLLGAPLEDGLPELAGVVDLSREGDGSWFLGRRGSSPGSETFAATI